MSKRYLKQSTSIDILSFSPKGFGLGNISEDNNFSVEVPFTLPGDKVNALLQGKKRGIYTATLEEVVTPSKDRIEARCLHFGLCGGCRWQHMAYHAQLQLKQEHVAKLFFPLLHPGTLIKEIAACDPPWNYRNKMEFSFSNDASGKQYLGLIINGSRGKVLNLMECHLVNSWWIQAVLATRHWWSETKLQAYRPHSNQGTLRTLTVREGIRSGDRLVMLTVSGNPEYALHKQQLESFVAFIREAMEPIDNSYLSIFLRIQQIAKGMTTNFYEMLLYGPDHIREELHIQLNSTASLDTLSFSISPSSFFQPNTKQAERLYSLALQLLDISPDSIVYDWYCGTGTLGICAAKQAKQVLGIEISPESSLDARANIARNNIKNMTVITGAVREVIAKIRQDNSFPLPDIVMIDPPRMGMDPDTIQHLGELQPRKILYISCNPITQVENIKALNELGYHLQVLQPVDQFPHTIHIENTAVLGRS